MRSLLAAFLLCFAVLAAPSAATAQVSGSLSGVWRGVFAGAGNQPTEFQANLADMGGRITGDTTELSTRGADSYFYLGDIRGTHQGDMVRFTKTYDGTGGRSHVVEYVGRVLPGGRRIVGTWSIGTTTGQFEMVR
ncbi:hypothetical protein [Terricaulis sp.]|uniref:hypothetical protein n=1 Tax=Terricaulis sp. TaxID=2768686 RepID=UPI003784493D